jgi:hypothetical protein
MIYGIVSGSIWFMIFLIFKISIFHLFQIKNKSGLIIKLFLSAVVGCILTSLIFTLPLMEMMNSLIVIFSFFILYMPFYYTISSSVSIQSLILLSEKDSQTCLLNELKNTFASPKILSYKLKSMESSGVLSSDGKKYKTTLRGKLIANTFQFIKKLWQLSPGG